MVITNKRIKNPLFFTFNDIEIKSVEEFKNSKLFAIKNLFI